MAARAKILNVPLISKRYANDCASACIAMVLHFDGYSDDYLHTAKDIGAHCKSFPGLSMPHAAAYMMDHQYDVTFQTMNTDLFHIGQDGASQQDLRKHVDWLRRSRFKNDRQHNDDLNQLAAMLRNGGELTVRLPSADDLRQEIDRQRPVIASVTNGFMGVSKKHRVGHNEHMVTIVGYDRDGFYVNDPEPAYHNGRTGHYDTSHMLFAIHAHTECAILKTSPKPR